MPQPPGEDTRWTCVDCRGDARGEGGTGRHEKGEVGRRGGAQEATGGREAGGRTWGGSETRKGTRGRG